MPSPILPDSLDTAIRLAVAGLVGLAIGIERQRSGHASGPGHDFAGTRTFLLLGLLGGLGGILVVHDVAFAGAALVAAGALLTISAYMMTARGGPADAVDGTTEVAALVVLALGLLAGGGALRLATGTGAVVLLALAEKRRLHSWVDRLDPAEMRAALQFAVLALVVLPLLPATLPTPLGELTPRGTSIFVLIISALNFSGHVARRMVGEERGYAVTGALGGVVSSTAVTWGFARESRRDKPLGAAYAVGVAAACTVLFPRVVVVVSLLNPDVALAVLPYLVAPFIAGAVISVWGGRAHRTSGEPAKSTPRSPLRLGTALQMAAAFQLVLLLMVIVRRQFGDAGVYTSAALFGATDVDALSVAMTRSGDAAFAPVAARAIGVGIASNTLLKLGVTLVLGRGAFRWRTALALTIMLAALAASLLLLP
jgi:uncharacterized membrane protein (DUF4010 family)